MQILADRLDLKVTIVNQRAEVYFHSQENNDTYDLVTSRAVASLNKILELSVPFLKIKGFAYILKSKGYEEELYEARGAIQALNLNLITTDIVAFEDKSYVGLLFEKIQKTNPNYPRD